MEHKTLNIISIVVVVGLIIFGWFYIFTYGKLDKSKQELTDDEIIAQRLIEETCLKYPDSPICNPDSEPVSDEELEKQAQALIEDTCTKYPDSPICNPDNTTINITDEELEEQSQDLIDETCSRYPDSPICQ